MCVNIYLYIIQVYISDLLEASDYINVIWKLVLSSDS